ncbi:DedA family protein [Rhizomonospora bruguierae]|uniref:DedA family protein n=1 Tax=Rhizomonospora bruguierae TaxID=1581705 RepID=UPI001BCAEFAC|nr:DedA family protein [Micromonospora sp. NBRC 107566]
MTALLDRLLALHGSVVYLLVGLLVFAEDALFVGFVIPGETAAILGGVAASSHHVALSLMCLVVVVAAIAGDSVGYEVGARYGTRLLATPPMRRRRERVEAARGFLARRGGPAVFLSRFVAFLRAVMPFLSGTVHMHYPRFLAYNAAGGIVWGVGNVVLGYLAGNSYRTVERTLGRVAAVVIAVVVVAAVVAWRIARRRHERRSPDAGG